MTDPTYPYDKHHHNPPAPMLPITVHIPGNSTKQVKTDALVDTGAEMTCLPFALVRALGAEPASAYTVRGVNGVFAGRADSYFLEFNIAGTKKLAEVIAFGEEPLLGRNLINGFILQFNGLTQELAIISGTMP